MKEGVLLFAIIAAVDARDRNARKNKDVDVHDHNASDYEDRVHGAHDHDGRYGTYGDYCDSNNDCGSGYYCDMHPYYPYCVDCPG